MPYTVAYMWLGVPGPLSAPNNCISVKTDIPELHMTAIEATYLKKIAETTPHSARLAFRGLADSTWEVHSGATRRLVEQLQGKDSKEHVRSPTFGKLYQSYHRSVLVEAARNHGFDTTSGQSDSDLQLLAKLQHLGAATGLIDFTWNSLVALWFATEKPHGRQCDGKVIVVDLNDTTYFRRCTLAKEEQTVGNIFPAMRGPTERQYYWEPQFRDEAANRILRQRSVFVVGNSVGPELPDTSILVEINISGEDKELLRQELERLFGVSEQSLFPDVHGFARANSWSSSITRLDDPDYFEIQGIELYQISEYTRAVAAYDECIRLDPKRCMTYFLRGNAKSELGNYFDAKCDYNVALELMKSGAVTGVPVHDALRNFYTFATFFNRGNTRFALGKYEEACDDYGEAIRTQPDPKSGSVSYNLANAKTKLGRFDSALVDYDAAIASKVRYARFNKGNALVAIGRFEDALQCFLKEREYGFELADNNIAIMCSVLGEIKDSNSVVTTHEMESSIVSGLTGVVVFKNESERSRLQSEPEEGWNTQGEGTTFLCTGSAGNIGNFGGEGSLGGTGLPGEGAYCLRMTW